MQQLWTDTAAFLAAGGSLLLTLAMLLLPVLPLLAWIAFWYLAVDWRKLKPALQSGGWLPLLVVTVGLVAIVAAIDTDPQPRTVGPLTVTPIASTVGWALILLATMFYAGSAQLSRRSRKRRVPTVDRLGAFHFPTDR